MHGFKLLAGPDWPHKLASSTMPFVVLMSMLLTIWLCSVVGKLFSERVYFSEFERLTRGLCLETSFPATFNQILNTVQKEHKPKTRLVLIGGDSVFFGQGQSESKYFSKRLAQFLGPDYSVVNLAMRGGKTFELAYWVLESLSKKDSDTILVTNSNFAYPGYPDGQSVYSYFFSDAQQKGFLRTYEKRDAFLKKSKDMDYVSEQKIWQRLDKYLYFRDFWSTLQYELFFTIWSYEPTRLWFEPRKNYKETFGGHETQPASTKEYKEWVHELQSRLNVVTFKDDQKGYVLKNEFWKDASTLVDATVMPDLRNRIYVCTLPFSRYEKEKAGLLDQKRSDMVDAETVKLYRDLGFKSVYIGELDNDDHADLEHFTDSGAEKVATLLAKEIKKVNENHDE